MIKVTIDDLALEARAGERLIDLINRPGLVPGTVGEPWRRDIGRGPRLGSQRSASLRVFIAQGCFVRETLLYGSLFLLRASRAQNDLCPEDASLRSADRGDMGQRLQVGR